MTHTPKDFEWRLHNGGTLASATAAHLFEFRWEHLATLGREWLTFAEHAVVRAFVVALGFAMIVGGVALTGTAVVVPGLAFLTLGCWIVWWGAAGRVENPA